MRHYFIVAGEISGDTHGSGLIRSLSKLDPSACFSGYGGPQMRIDGGSRMVDWVEMAGVVGLWEVLKMYGYFKQKMREALDRVKYENPDMVILVDYPGFNLRLAKSLRKQGYKGKILYYISPQVWAWKKGRVKTMAKVLDLVVCIFPFEEGFYRKSGLRAVFAGHPMVDRVKALKTEEPRESQLVGFFPGSRSNEVKRLVPVMLKTAKLLTQQIPELKFMISAANEKLADLMRVIMEKEEMPEAKEWIRVGGSQQWMQKVEVGLVASGTATLEAACLGLPYLLIYKVNPLTYVVGKAVMKIKFLGMVNILADRWVVKEMIQGNCKPEKLTPELIDLLIDQKNREVLSKDLLEVTSSLGAGDAYDRAAKVVSEV